MNLGSIHPSVERRRLLDLQQSLHITAAFEFYVRRYLPPMIEEKEYHRAVKESLDQLIDKNTGKPKKYLNH